MSRRDRCSSGARRVERCRDPRRFGAQCDLPVFRAADLDEVERCDAHRLPVGRSAKDARAHAHRDARAGRGASQLVDGREDFVDTRHADEQRMELIEAHFLFALPAEKLAAWSIRNRSCIALCLTWTDRHWPICSAPDMARRSLMARLAEAHFVAVAKARSAGGGAVDLRGARLRAFPLSVGGGWIAYVGEVWRRRSLMRPMKSRSTRLEPAYCVPGHSACGGNHPGRKFRRQRRCRILGWRTRRGCAGTRTCRQRLPAHGHMIGWGVRSSDAVFCCIICSPGLRWVCRPSPSYSPLWCSSTSLVTFSWRGPLGFHRNLLDRVRNRGFRQDRQEGHPLESLMAAVGRLCEIPWRRECHLDHTRPRAYRATQDRGTSGVLFFKPLYQRALVAAAGLWRILSLRSLSTWSCSRATARRRYPLMWVMCSRIRRGRGRDQTRDRSRPSDGQPVRLFYGELQETLQSGKARP